MARKQFSFYRSIFENIEKLSTMKEKLQAYEMICGYALDEREPDLSDKKPDAAMLFQLARPNLEAAHRRSRAALSTDNVYRKAGLTPQYVREENELEELFA